MAQLYDRQSQQRRNNSINVEDELLRTDAISMVERHAGP
jgi:hypothetical protein